MTTRELTEGALASAAIVVMLAIPILFPTFSVTCAAFAGFIIMAMHMKWGMKTALLTYFSAALLSMLLISNKETPVLFLMLFGHYPVIKAVIERRSGPIRNYILKLLYFNLDVAIVYYVVDVLFNFPTMEEDIPLWAALLLLNVVFLFYDYTFTPLMRVLTRRFNFFFRR